MVANVVKDSAEQFEAIAALTLLLANRLPSLSPVEQEMFQNSSRNLLESAKNRRVSGMRLEETLNRLT